MNAFACSCREPDLDDVMKDPIVRLLMRQDRVTDADIRKLAHRAPRPSLPFDKPDEFSPQA